MYTYGISFQLCFVPPWFLLQSWTAGIPPGVLHGHSFGQHFVVLFCLLHAARVSGSGSDAIKDQWDLSAQYLGCWEHPCILTSIFAKENRTWICTGCLLWKPNFFPFCYFLPVYCKLTQWFHNFCALQKLGQQCYYSLCWLQPVISLYFMDPYIFSKNGGSAAWALITIVE